MTLPQKENKKLKYFHIRCGEYVSKLKDGYFCAECGSYILDENLAVRMKDLEVSK